MSWTNSDGLLIKFGREEGTVGGLAGNGYASEYSVMQNGQHVVEVVLNDLTALGSSAEIISDTVTIPSGARIDEIVVICDTVATSSGSNATLNFGLIDQDRTTEHDYNGFIAALALTAYNAAGETTVITAGSTGAGALIGTTLSNAGLITADYDTEAFTAGKLRLLIKYKMAPLV
jgi:hypothetical protein